MSLSRNMTYLVLTRFKAYVLPPVQPRFSLSKVSSMKSDPEQTSLSLLGVSSSELLSIKINLNGMRTLFLTASIALSVRSSRPWESMTIVTSRPRWSAKNCAGSSERFLCAFCVRASLTVWMFSRPANEFVRLPCDSRADLLELRVTDVLRFKDSAHICL